MDNGTRTDQQLAELGPVPTDPGLLKAWEHRVLDIIFGGHTCGCGCNPHYPCIHEEDR
jgi:hypothetical protein